MSEEVNSISLARFDKKDWIVRKEKFNRYKIVNFKRFSQRELKKPRAGKAIFVYDRGDSLILASLNYVPDQQAKNNFRSSTTKFIIKVINGHLVVWDITKEFGGGNATTPHALITKIRNHSGFLSKMHRILSNFGKKNFYNRPWPKELKRKPAPAETLDEFDLPSVPLECYPEVVGSESRKIKVVNQRLNWILFNFLKRHKIKINRVDDFFHNLRLACYPNSSGFELKEYDMHPIFSRHFLHGDIKYVIKRCFGHDSAKLVKLVCERIQKDKSFNILLLGCLLKKLIPLDYFHQIIPNVSTNRLQSMKLKTSNFRLRDCRGLLKRYNAARVLKLINSNDFNDHLFPDTVMMFSQAPSNVVLPEKPRNWQEVHDRLIPARAAALREEARKQRAAMEFELPIRDYMKKIDNAIVGGMRIEVPNHTLKLGEYAAQMKNCIWGYGSRVKSGSCDIIGVYRSDVLLYNISISNKQIEQFKAKRNEEPNAEDKEKITNFLLNERVIDLPPILVANTHRDLAVDF